MTPVERLNGLARQMAAFSPDAVVLAGDLAESLTDLVRCLKLFRQAGMPPLAYPLELFPDDAIELIRRARQQPPVPGSPNVPAPEGDSRMQNEPVDGYRHFEGKHDDSDETKKLHGMHSPAASWVLKNRPGATKAKTGKA